MTQIGLISDTHSFIDLKIFTFFKNCDEIWHAGDNGDISILEQLREFKPTIAVYGNIDGISVRRECPLHYRFMCEDVDVWITHIGGYPKNYSPSIRK